MAKYLNGSRAEVDIDLVIKVEDENDCKPVIEMQQVGYVKESSAAGTRRSIKVSHLLFPESRLTFFGIFLGTIVMIVKATDADETGTPASQIFYRIDQSSNAAGMFSINSVTGEIFVQRNRLDREVKI